MATTQELIALFGDDFNDVLKGLSALPPEAREILDQAMGKMLFDADVFSSRVRKAVQTQTAAGISMEAIKAGLLTDMNTGGAVFGEIRNAIKGSLVEGINQSGRAGQFQALDPDENTLFTWVTVAGHKICQDCAPRGGFRKTLKEWESEGLPGTGWSVCKGHCYCILDASGKISPRVERETGLLSEKGATIRSKTPTQKTKSVPKEGKLNILDPKMAGKHTTVASAQKWALENSKKGINYILKADGTPKIRFKGRSNAVNKFNYRGMSIENANRLNELLAESFKRSDDLGIPRLRGIKAGTGRNAVADMGDGVMGFNKNSMRWAGSTIKRYKKWGYSDDKINELLDIRWKNHIKDMKDGKRPYTSDGLLMKNRNDSMTYGDSTFWHEYGHHIHQQKNVISEETYGGRFFNPYENKIAKLRVELDNIYGSARPKRMTRDYRPDRRHYPTRYSEQDTYEWFAENYSLHMAGRDDLLTPEFVQFLKDEGIF